MCSWGVWWRTQCPLKIVKKRLTHNLSDHGHYPFTRSICMLQIIRFCHYPQRIMKPGTKGGNISHSWNPTRCPSEQNEISSTISSGQEACHTKLLVKLFKLPGSSCSMAERSTLTIDALMHHTDSRFERMLPISFLRMRLLVCTDESDIQVHSLDFIELCKNATTVSVNLTEHRIKCCPPCEVIVQSSSSFDHHTDDSFSSVRWQTLKAFECETKIFHCGKSNCLEMSHDGYR